MLGSDRQSAFVSTELLSAWTDPDTAMEAVGASLGLFDEQVSDVRRALATESPLRNALYQVLLDLVDGGVLEKRALADGRFAFRWRETIEISTLSIVPDPAPPVVEAGPAEHRERPARRWPQFVAPTAPLVLPFLSCVIAILAFVWLDHVLALLIAVALTLVGVVGLLRRVPFAGLWIMGVLVAGVLLRLS